ncbi:MAG: hypothetical protein ACFFGZ_01935 [Candidatus Thorarchaeota archaeon]
MTLMQSQRQSTPAFDFLLCRKKTFWGISRPHIVISQLERKLIPPVLIVQLRLLLNGREKTASGNPPQGITRKTAVKRVKK